MIPSALRRFVELVNRGEFWESHEVLEELWRENGSDFLQGLILYASAFVHAKRGNRHGVGAQLDKAGLKLESYPDAYLGVDLAALRAHLRRCRRIVGEHPDAKGDAWVELIPFPEMELREEWVRGDEVEGEDGARP